MAAAEVNRDETAFRRRTGASDALSRLRSASESLVYRIRGDRVDLLLGRSLGGLQLAAARDTAAVQDFVRRFYRDYWVLFSAPALPEGSLRVERVRSASTTVAEVRQYIDGIPVMDARWTLLFDRAGHLTHVMGAPFDPARITVGRRPGIDAEQAVALALDHESLTREDVQASANLAIEGSANRLVWTAELNGRRDPSLFREVGLDAHHRTVIASHDCCARGVAAIPVTHYSHPGGIKDSTARLTTTDINVDDDVDVVEPTDPTKKPDHLPPPETTYSYSLQRIGSGRSRIWDAKPTGADTTPHFTRTVSKKKDYFTKQPGNTANNVFNEQQTYFWAQTLKTAVDEWGREPNDYGHYPVDPARAVNVEIVVNGDASMENDWKSRDENWGVMHGFIRNNAPRSWFPGRPSSPSAVQAVFLFNSAGNSNSPQFFGPEYSSSYSIIAHEVGHFITWQYGDWRGPSGTTWGSSLGEGHSMVLPALLGKQHFGVALEYDESEYVTTGGGNGNGQWSHFVYGQPPLKYSDMDFNSLEYYWTAWPFVQAMWQLMNNMDVNGKPIWGSADAAISNTADLFMYSVYCFTSDTTMTWDKLCLGLLAYCDSRIDDGIEKDPLPGSWWGVGGVLSQHGSLTECKKSPP